MLAVLKQFHCQNQEKGLQKCAVEQFSATGPFTAGVMLGFGSAAGCSCLGAAEILARARGRGMRLSRLLTAPAKGALSRTQGQSSGSENRMISSHE